MRTGGESAPELTQARQWLAALAAEGRADFGLIAQSEQALIWLQTLGLDDASQMAALLFAGFDGSPGATESFRKRWGAQVSSLLVGLNRLTRFGRQVGAGDGPDTPDQIETLRRMLLALAEDVRVVMIALALHVARLEALAAIAKTDPDRHGPAARQAGLETLQVQAPLANRLGIWQIKWALEDLAFRLTEPQTYRRIAALLDEKRPEREAFVGKTIAEIRTLVESAAISADVAGRPKHLFSIRNKMQAKHLGFDELRDIRAFRVLVDTESQCYAVLGLLHDHWTPMAEEFDDYITRPKTNGYQSLHTVLLDSEGRPFEVQIRTHDMHQRAELGIAAHWKYKESGSPAQAEGDYAERIAWLRQMLDWGRGDLGQVRLSDDRVYALTPKARIIELPRGATPLDFAYHLHTEIGHRCRGAKIDGQIVSLTTEIKTGQTVELLTAKLGGPSRDWMNPDAGYLKSARARQKVRSYFHGLDSADAEGSAKTKAEAEQAADKPSAGLSRAESAESVILSKISRARPADRAGVLVVGVDRMLTALARCCKPAPPDEICGFVTRLRGVSVHWSQCPTFERMAKASPERVIKTTWAEQGPNSEARYPVDAMLTAKSRGELIRDVAEVLAREKISILRMDSFLKADVVTLSMTLSVADGHQLARALAMLRDIPGVALARRA